MTRIIEVKMKPCPFCGSGIVEYAVKENDRDERCWFVECQECFAKGPAYVAHEDGDFPAAVHVHPFDEIVTAVSKAAAAWNRRAVSVDG